MNIMKNSMTNFILENNKNHKKKNKKMLNIEINLMGEKNI